MKRISLKKFVRAILSTVLALLGFSGCSSDDKEKDFPVMYGTFNPDFELKGNVVQQEDPEQPIVGIRVITRLVDDEEGKQGADTVFTREDGAFFLRRRPRTQFKVTLEDVDGEKNGGVFKKKVLEVDGNKLEEEDLVYDEERKRYQYRITVEMEKENEEEEK